MSCILVCDGLKGLPQAVEAVWPQTIVQTCIVHADKGVGVGRIVAELRLDPKTLRRFMQAAGPEELIGANPTGRQSSLDGHAAYLTARWAEGCTSTSMLHQDPRARSAGERTHSSALPPAVAREHHAHRPTTRAEDPRGEHPRPHHPDNLAEADRLLLAELRDRCADLDAAGRLVARFAEMLVHRRGTDKLDGSVRKRRGPSLP